MLDLDPGCCQGLGAGIAVGNPGAGPGYQVPGDENVPWRVSK